MKKILALIIALTMIFSLVACDFGSKDPCTHADENGDGVCDLCGETLNNGDGGNGDGGNGDTASFSETLSAAVIAQFASAKSMKVDLTAEVTETATGWQQSDVDGTLTEKSETNSSKLKGTITFVRTDDGFNTKIEMEIRTTPNGEEEKVDNVAYYIIDGLVYIYDSAVGIYVNTDSIDIAGPVAQLSAIFSGVELDADTVQEAAAELTEELIEAMNIESAKGGSVTVDFKPTVDSLVAYINALNLETTTVSDVLDDVLALVDEDLTTEALINELDRISGLTVNAALGELDAWLTAEYNTTLQGIYNSVMANEDFITVLTNFLSQLAGSTEEQVQAQINMLKTFVISDFINAQGLGNVTVYDLIISLVPDPNPSTSPDPGVGTDENPEAGTDENPEAGTDVNSDVNPEDNVGDSVNNEEPSQSEEGDVPGTITKDEFFATVRNFAALTLKEFDETVGTPVFATLKRFSTLSVSACNVTANLELNTDNTVKTFGVGGNLDFTLGLESGYEGKSNSVHVTASFAYSVHTISNSTVDISLPADAIVMPGITYLPIYANDVYVGQVIIKFTKDGMDISVYDYSSENTKYADFEGVPYSAFANNVLTISPEYLVSSSEGTTVTANIVLRYDPELSVWNPVTP